MNTYMKTSRQYLTRNNERDTVKKSNMQSNYEAELLRLRMLGLEKTEERHLKKLKALATNEGLIELLHPEIYSNI